MPSAGLFIHDLLFKLRETLNNINYMIIFGTTWIILFIY